MRRWKRFTTGILALVALALLGTVSGRAFVNPPPRPLGVYVFATMTNYASAISQVANGPFPGVQGFDYVVGWSVINGTKTLTGGSYDFTLVNQALAATAADGKQFQMALLPGRYEPSWVTANDPTITIKDASGNDVVMANPVDSAFQTQWFSLIAALTADLSTQPAESDIVSLQTTGGGDQGEMEMGSIVTPATWTAAGITPSTLESFWEKDIAAWEHGAEGWEPNVALAIEDPIGGGSNAILPTIFSYDQSHPVIGVRVGYQNNGLKDSTSESGSYWQDLNNESAYARVGWQTTGFGSER